MTRTNREMVQIFLFCGRIFPFPFLTGEAKIPANSPQHFPALFPITNSYYGSDSSRQTSTFAFTTTFPRVSRRKRIKPGCELLVPEIEAELNREFRKVDWIPGFFSIPPQVQIASSNAYRQGKIYGIDAASGAAVLALGVSPGDHVLDLCAAPGAKLYMLSDILGKSGSLTGVDVSRQRLAACRTLLQKYAIGDYCRMFVADGTTFSLFPVRSNINEIPCKEDETSVLGT